MEHSLSLQRRHVNNVLDDGDGHFGHVDLLLVAIELPALAHEGHRVDLRVDVDLDVDGAGDSQGQPQQYGLAVDAIPFPHLGKLALQGFYAVADAHARLSDLDLFGDGRQRGAHGSAAAAAVRGGLPQSFCDFRFRDLELPVDGFDLGDGGVHRYHLALPAFLSSDFFNLQLLIRRNLYVESRPSLGVERRGGSSSRRCAPRAQTHAARDGLDVLRVFTERRRHCLLHCDELPARQLAAKQCLNPRGVGFH
mmetsp:Transcript_10811/g.26435  ORF Transcript_10811/g.26435 Transcript_10811/m.26435 type:complete len:251 (-) Transcript_10811:6614-7366(-)